MLLVGKAGDWQQAVEEQCEQEDICSRGGGKRGIWEAFEEKFGEKLGKNKGTNLRRNLGRRRRKRREKRSWGSEDNRLRLAVGIEVIR